MAVPAEPPVPDGRRARRERNRTAVIDAMFALLSEGHVPPSVADIADRSGVSVSSVFRYFDGLDDLQEQTVDRYFERYAPLFEVPEPGRDTRATRIDVFVGSRLDLYEATAPIARMARMRAPEHPRIASSLRATRERFTEQIRSHFRADLVGQRPAAADDRVALVDALTTFESWDLLHSVHGRTRLRIERAWKTGIDAVLA